MKTLKNLFGLKQAPQLQVAIEEKPILKGKTTNQIIEEIHETFYTEVDKLLADAKISNSLETTKGNLIEKCKRLKALGFTNTAEVKEAEGEIERLNKLESENKEKQTLIDAINYFNGKYPQYKFITEDSVRKICKKYNLIYGSIDKYIGKVPDKNLKQIEDFKISEEDIAIIKETSYRGFMVGKQIVSKSEHTAHLEEKANTLKSDYMRMHIYSGYDSYTKLGLEIAAPLKDFDTKNMKVENFQLSKIEIPDPVVLHPVLFNKSKFYLIVTAWGIEASDSEVVNQNMN